MYVQVYNIAMRNLFTGMCDAKKRWPSNKFKENFETYLKLHCYAAIIKIMKYLDACMASLNNRLYS